MKLNLAALPKEEAWRIWRMAFISGAAAQYVGHENPALLGHASTAELVMTAVRENLSAPQFDDPTDACRGMFDEWWSEQTGQGETPSS